LSARNRIDAGTVSPSARAMAVVAALAAAVAALQQEPNIGDGVVYRVAVQVQRRFWTPPIEQVGKYR
jgi:hypothetical protein